MAVRYGENESEAPRWADHLAMNGRIVRSHFGIRFRPVAKWKKTFAFSDDPIVRYFNSFLSIISANWIFYFLFKKKVPPPNEWKFLQSKFFQISKKNLVNSVKLVRHFFFLPKSVIWREKTTNEWRRGTKKKKSAGRPEALRLPNAFFFFLVENIFFSLKFHFPRSEKKVKFPKYFKWMNIPMKNSDFFFFSKSNFDSFQNKMQIGAGQWTRSMSFDTQQKNSFAYSNKGLVKAGQSNFT